MYASVWPGEEGGNDIRDSYETRIQKEHECLALLGLVGEDKLRPYMSKLTFHP